MRSSWLWGFPFFGEWHNSHFSPSLPLLFWCLRNYSTTQRHLTSFTTTTDVLKKTQTWPHMCVSRLISPICVVISQLLAFPGAESSPWHSSRGLLWITRPLKALWRIFCLPPACPGFDNTLRSHTAQMCSPDACRCALPGGVKEILKTNGSASINTWSPEGKEAFPGLAPRYSITSQLTTTCKDALTGHFWATFVQLKLECSIEKNPSHLCNFKMESGCFLHFPLFVWFTLLSNYFNRYSSFSWAFVINFQIKTYFKVHFMFFDNFIAAEEKNVFFLSITASYLCQSLLA